MQLTNRDIEIINFIEKNGGATINQIAQLFFTNYTTCSIRLRKLSDNKFLKVAIQPHLGKKVYYKKKMPSFHALVINNILIENIGNVDFYEREYKIKNFKVDCIIILKSGTLLIIEIDIYNQTKNSKINNLIDILNYANVGKFEIRIYGIRERKDKIKGVKYINILRKKI